tara:strand:+ start:131 stop:601 length:471 start_codon:yes stop_codon:yes gene_type:complete
MLRCDICDRDFETEGGRELHMKVFHADKEVKETKAESKKGTLSVLSTEDLEDRSKAFRARLKKRSKRGPIELSVGKKLTKVKLCALFKDDPPIGNWWNEKPLSKILKRGSYKITRSKKMANGWKQYTLESSTQSVSWKEGPLRGSHCVGLPSVVTF